MKKTRLGFCMTGSFCTFSKTIEVMKSLARAYEILPVMSENAYGTDTRFGEAKAFVEIVEEICGKEVIHTVVGAEPIGPHQLTDVMLVAPCTGNTLAKLASGITDGPATMAAKAHLRGGRPLVVALATNDALGASAQNIGRLLNTRNVYFVPFRQDDSAKKPRSVVADFACIEGTVEAALSGEQAQPILGEAFV